MADSPVWAAVRTVKSGMTGKAGLALARAGGLRISTQTWYRVVSEVRSSLGSQMVEITRPLNRKPIENEIQQMTTKVATGVLHYVDIYVKDRATGLVATRPFAVKSRDVLARGTVVKQALAAFINAVNNDPSGYPEQVIGALYTATYRMNPTG